MFAKLFEDGDTQILVRLENDDEGKPAVGVHFQLPGGEFENIRTSFDDDDSGWEKAEEMLAGVTIEQLRPAVAEASVAAQEIFDAADAADSADSADREY